MLGTMCKFPKKLVKEFWGWYYMTTQAFTELSFDPSLCRDNTWGERTEQDKKIKMDGMEYRHFQCLERGNDSDPEPLSSTQPSFFSEQLKAWSGWAHPILTAASQTGAGASFCTCKQS